MLSLRNNIISIFLLLFFAAEAYCVTYYVTDRGGGGFFNTNILFVLSGLAICILPFLLEPAASPRAPLKKRYLNLAILSAGITALTVYCFIIGYFDFSVSPVDMMKADMIPQIQVCCNRLLNGEKIYAPMKEIWDGMHPTYMPMMWLPWLPFERWTNDLRWASVVFYVAGLSIILLLFPFERKGKTAYIFPFLLVFGFLTAVIFEWEEFFIQNIQETVVFFYYLLLGYGLIKKNPWITGIAIACCMLSRYALVFWIPVYLVYTYFFESKKNALIMFGIVTVMELCIFILPFYIWQPKYFSDVIVYYHNAMKGFNRNDALSFGSLFTNNESLIRAEFLASLLPPFLCLGGFYLFRNKLMANKDFFGICALKFTLLAFYSFISIPFPYLFFLPALFSAPICMYAIRKS